MVGNNVVRYAIAMVCGVIVGLIVTFVSFRFVPMSADVGQFVIPLVAGFVAGIVVALLLIFLPRKK